MHPFFNAKGKLKAAPQCSLNRVCTAIGYGLNRTLPNANIMCINVILDICGRFFFLWKKHLEAFLYPHFLGLTWRWTHAFIAILTLTSWPVLMEYDNER